MRRKLTTGGDGAVVPYLLSLPSQFLTMVPPRLWAVCKQRAGGATTSSRTTGTDIAAAIIRRRRSVLISSWKHQSNVQQCCNSHRSISSCSSNSSSSYNSNLTLLGRRFHSSLSCSSSSSSSSSHLFYLFPQQKKQLLLRQEQRRYISNPITTISSWVRDVINTKSLQPPNPILQSIQEARDSTSPTTTTKTTGVISSSSSLPSFAYMLPYHLEPAAFEIIRQYHVELAQLEVTLTRSLSSLSEPEVYKIQSSSSILSTLDYIEAPIHQLLQIGYLFSQLSIEVDDSIEWKRAYENVQLLCLEEQQIMFHTSNIIYKALTMSMSPTPPRVSSRLLQSFYKRGAHITVRPEQNSDDDSSQSNSSSSSSSSSSNESMAEQLQEIQQQISILRHRLSSSSTSSSMDFLGMPRSTQLQIVSDLYNIIGLTQQQAQLLGYKNACDMELLLDNTNNTNSNRSHYSFPTSTELQLFHETISKLIQPTLSPHIAQLDEELFDGAFLGGKQQQQQGGSGIGSSGSSSSMEEKKILWQANQSMKRFITLNGVLQGIFDLTQALLGVTILEEKDSSKLKRHIWERDVRLFHVYYNNNNQDSAQPSLQQQEEQPPDPSTLLGSFYMDPYQRSTKSYIPNSWLFTHRTSQTLTPVAIMSLSLERPWDDDPTPLTWDMTRAVLYNYGNVLQYILSHTTTTTTSNSSNQDGTTTPHHQKFTRQGSRLSNPPVDVSDFLAHFMEMWLQNDGFVQRLATLSEKDKEGGIPLELLEVLRKNLVTQKTKQWMQQIFLGELERTLWSNFDPRNTSTSEDDDKDSNKEEKESLTAMQRRLAELYIPNDVPDSKDLSPLLEIFTQGNTNDAATTVDDEPLLTAYTSLWSEVLSANVYAAFQEALTIKTSSSSTTEEEEDAEMVGTNNDDTKKSTEAEVATKNKVEQLGRGIRTFFLPPPLSSNTGIKSTGNVTMADLEVLCGGKKITAQALEQVYRFGEEDEESSSTNIDE